MFKLSRFGGTNFKLLVYLKYRVNANKKNAMHTVSTNVEFKTWTESTLIISPRAFRHRAVATELFPTAVGPK